MRPDREGLKSWMPPHPSSWLLKKARGSGLRRVGGVRPAEQEEAQGRGAAVCVVRGSWWEKGGEADSGCLGSKDISPWALHTGLGFHPDLPQVWATWLMREDQGGAQAVPCGTQVQILVESLSSRDRSPKLPSHLVYYFLAHVNFHFMDEETGTKR